MASEAELGEFEAALWAKDFAKVGEIIKREAAKFGWTAEDWLAAVLMYAEFERRQEEKRLTGQLFDGHDW